MSRPNNSRRRGKGKGKNNHNVDAMIISSNHGAAKGDVLSVSSDLRQKQPSFNLVQSPPKNFLNAIHWIKDSFNWSTTISGAAGVTELNQAFNLGQCANATAVASLYDQYCIYSVHTKIMMTGNAIITAAVSYGQLYTALDYDNASNITTVSAIQQYSSVESSEIYPGKSYERYLKPCVGNIIGSSNGSAVTTNPARLWVNSSSTSQPHYGLRTINVGNSTAQTYGLDAVSTFVIGLRNSF